MSELLDCTVTGTSGVISITFSDSHVAPTSTATITAISTTLDIGDNVQVELGYAGDTFICLTGFVKNVEYKEPERQYSITCANVLARAIDFFIASDNPDEPFERQNISAEDLIGDLLELAGITDYDPDPTSFTFAINNPVQVNLTPCYDYCHFLADIIAFTIFADTDGTVKLIDRRPYPVGGDTSDYTFTVADVLEATYEKSDLNIRNKVIVYGSAGISAIASEPSPYLPDDFYRTVVVAAPGVIDTQEMAELSAEYNLELLNRLTQKVNLVVIGRTGVVPRTIATITLPDIGVTGDWYVYSIEHNWSKAGYITNLELRR